MNLREMRLDASMTQDAVGARLGVDKSTVSQWERGVAYPHQSKYGRLAELYNVSTDELHKACEEAHLKRQKMPQPSGSGRKGGNDGNH